MDMAIDEALLEAVGRGESIPVIRLYGFSPPTLSLGRFQRARDLLDRDGLSADGVTLVRRPTGGHAVLHDDELTYSVCLGKDSGLGVGNAAGAGTRKRAVYEFIAAILLQGLSNLGVEGRVNASQQGDLHNPDCFATAGEYEITAAGGRKLIGSAQMATRHAILQHGSIPMANPGNRVGRYFRSQPGTDADRLSQGSPRAPADAPTASLRAPTCLNELAGRALGFEEVRGAFARAFKQRVGAVVSELSGAEESAARLILRDRYASDAWNLSR